MVSRKEKSRAVQFIGDKLFASGLYGIINTTPFSLLAGEISPVEEPRTIEVLIPNFFRSVSAFQEKRRENQRKRVYTSPIFYKDGKTAFVRMVETNSSWRQDKSLKNYSLEEINQMLSLRGMEKAVLDLTEDELSYYQPPTNNLEESLRTFHLQTVALDYSHLDFTDSGYGFARDGPSIDYKLPQETETKKITQAARFSFPGNFLACLVPDNSLAQRIGGLLHQEEELLEREGEEAAYPLTERIGIMLDSCSPEELKRLARRFGPEALGGYAPE